MDAMAEGIRRIDATTATYSEFADVMEKNQPVSGCKCVTRRCRTAVVYTEVLQSAVAKTSTAAVQGRLRPRNAMLHLLAPLSLLL